MTWMTPVFPVARWPLEVSVTYFGEQVTTWSNRNADANVERVS